MTRSLTFRIAALGIVVATAMIALVLMLIDASDRTNDSFRWATHSADVIETMDRALMELRDAESGQRGFILTHNADFSRSFDQDIADSRAAMQRVVELTSDNPLQTGRMRVIRRLMEARIRFLYQPLNLAKAGRFNAARLVVANGPGRDLMGIVTRQAGIFLTEERRL